MIEVNGLIIEATPQEVLNELKSQLERNGEFLFKKIKPARDNIQFSCPFHAGGQESHPSCGMSTTITMSRGRVVPIGTVHCFTCGYTAELSEFVSNVFGRLDGGFYGNQWLKKNYSTSQVVIRQPLRLNMSRGQTSEQTVNPIKFVSEEELDSYRYYNPYMWKRGLTEELVEMFDIGYDKEKKCLTFPVHDENGKVPFLQTRSIGTKFHHYEEGVNKTDYLYGVYEGMKYYPNASEWVVTESILNALTWWRYGTPITGIPAVALMGVGGGEQFRLLRKLSGRSLILALDPDNAGEQAMQKIRRILRRNKVIKRFEYPDWMYSEKKDINDIGEQVLDLPINLF